ncbi:MAG: rod-binding protein [Novosphingobium sp.]
MIAPLSALPATQGSDRERLAEVAKGFEAFFLRQMLAAARKADFGEPLLGGQGLDTFRQMQDDRFAEIAAQSGAFGLAKQIEAQLARFVAQGASTSSARTDLGLSSVSIPVRPEPVEGPAAQARGA